MADTEFSEAARMAAVAAAAGGVARVALAMHAGVRRAGVLAIEALVGATLGVMAAAAAVYWDPSLRDAGWPLLMVGGAAGFAGAAGTRLLDLIVAAIQARTGGPR